MPWVQGPDFRFGHCVLSMILKIEVSQVEDTSKIYVIWASLCTILKVILCYDHLHNPFPSTSSLQKICNTWFLLRNHFLKRKTLLQNIHPGDFYSSFCVWWGDILCINVNILKVMFAILKVFFYYQPIFPFIICSPRKRQHLRTRANHLASISQYTVPFFFSTLSLFQTSNSRNIIQYPDFY